MELKDDKFQLYYIESIMQNSNMPSINKIKEYFDNLSLEDFINTIEEIINRNNHDLFQLYLYYIILFRDDKNIQDYINSPKLSIDVLEKLVMFTYGYCFLYDYTIERILDEMLYFIKNDRLLDLILNAKFISKDILLVLYILSKLDTESLNLYFKRIHNINDFLTCFINTPDDIMRAIIERNYKLFQYIMLLVSDSEFASKISNDFFYTYKSYIEQLSKFNDIIREYKSNTNLDQERDIPFHKRDMKRISFLINQIRDTPDPIKTIEYFDSEKIFADVEEKIIITAIISNPILKDTFKYYDKMFSV